MTRWGFDNIPEGFDNHIKTQLPWYDLCTRLVCHIATSYMPPKGVVLDVGASTGNITRSLYCVSPDAVYHSVEPDMPDKWCGMGSLHGCSIEDYNMEPEQFDVVIAMLTFSFVHPSTRAASIKKCIDGVKKGGAVIIVDKFHNSNGELSRSLHRFTMNEKLRLGCTPEAVIAKETSLIGVQRTLCESELDGWLDVFRVGDFVGKVFLK